MVRSLSLKCPSHWTDSRRVHSSNLPNDWSLIRWQRDANIQRNPTKDPKNSKDPTMQHKKGTKDGQKLDLIRGTLWRCLIRYSKGMKGKVTWMFDCKISSWHLGTDQEVVESGPSCPRRLEVNLSIKESLPPTDQWLPVSTVFHLQLGGGEQL